MHKSKVFDVVLVVAANRAAHRVLVSVGRVLLDTQGTLFTSCALRQLILLVLA